MRGLKKILRMTEIIKKKESEVKMDIDWQRYDDIAKKDPKEWTEEERKFFNYMYCIDEHKSGLDGDR